MKKLMIAGACGLMLFVACAFSNDTKPNPNAFGTGMYMYVKI